jgi:hypothetical protein
MHGWMRSMGLPGCLTWEIGLDAGRANPSGAIVKEGKAVDAGRRWRPGFGQVRV